MAAHRKEYPEAITMYESGLSVADVAGFYGITRQAMWAWLKLRGVAFRPNAKKGAENPHFRGGQSFVKKTHLTVERALKKGVLVRPTTCEECGKSCVPANGRPQIEAHHNDYNKPLTVRWLCRACHYEWHKTNKPIGLRSTQEK